MEPPERVEPGEPVEPVEPAEPVEPVEPAEPKFFFRKTEEQVIFINFLQTQKKIFS